jgi:hypothetical protein
MGKRKAGRGKKAHPKKTKHASATPTSSSASTAAAAQVDSIDASLAIEQRYHLQYLVWTNNIEELARVLKTDQYAIPPSPSPTTTTTTTPCTAAASSTPATHRNPADLPINKRDHRGNTALHIAIHLRKADMVQLLLHHSMSLLSIDALML